MLFFACASLVKMPFRGYFCFSDGVFVIQLYQCQNPNFKCQIKSKIKMIKQEI